LTRQRCNRDTIGQFAMARSASRKQDPRPCPREPHRRGKAFEDMGQSGGRNALPGVAHDQIHAAVLPRHRNGHRAAGSRSLTRPHRFLRSRTNLLLPCRPSVYPSRAVNDSAQNLLPIKVGNEAQRTLFATDPRRTYLCTGAGLRTLCSLSPPSVRRSLAVEGWPATYHRVN